MGKIASAPSAAVLMARVQVVSAKLVSAQAVRVAKTVAALAVQPPRRKKQSVQGLQEEIVAMQSRRG